MPLVEVVVVQGPKGSKVVIRLVQGHEQFGQQKGEAELEEHDGECSPPLVAVVTVFHQKFYTKTQNRRGVKNAVDKPLACGIAREGFAQWVEHSDEPLVGGAVGPQSEVLGVEVQHYVEGSEREAEGPCGPFSRGQWSKPHAVVVDAGRAVGVLGPGTQCHGEDKGQRYAPGAQCVGEDAYIHPAESQHC